MAVPTEQGGNVNKDSVLDVFAFEEPKLRGSWQIHKKWHHWPETGLYLCSRWCGRFHVSPCSRSGLPISCIVLLKLNRPQELP